MTSLSTSHRQTACSRHQSVAMGIVAHAAISVLRPPLWRQVVYYIIIIRILAIFKQLYRLKNTTTSASRHRDLSGQWLCAALAEHRHNISVNSSACLQGSSIPHLALGYQGFILWHDAGVLYRLNNVLAAASNLAKACCAQISQNFIGTYCIIVRTIYTLQKM